MEPEWGFPKGRRSQHESEFLCAVREFREETGWHHALPVCSTDIAPLTEIYTGSNGITYRQVYYIGLCPTTDSDVEMDVTNHVQVREVSAVRWCSLDEAITKIRGTSPEKRALVEMVRTQWDHIDEVHVRSTISLRETEDGRRRHTRRNRGTGASI